MARDSDEAAREALRLLGETIRKTREEQGLDVDELAAGTGLTPAEVRALEAGHFNADADLLFPIPADEDQRTREVLRTLGEAIRQTREEHGIDVEQIAAETGISPAEIQALEAGQRQVTMYALFRISTAVGSDAAEIRSLAQKIERHRHRPPSKDHDGK